MKRLLCVLALLLSPAAQAQTEACTLPGELVVEDPAGDDLLAPTGEGFGDILALHMAEPGGGGQLVVTFTLADLAMQPPSTAWMLRFVTDEMPAGVEEFFFAMVTDPAGMPHFVHGTAAAADPAGQAGLLFTPAGPLNAQSGFSADGTLTLVLDKSDIAEMVPRAAIFGMVPLVHRITPTDGTEPFAYGFRSVGGVLLAYDEAASGYYELLAEGACAGSGKSLLGIGALPWTTLVLLVLAGLGLRRRKYTIGENS